MGAIPSLSALVHPQHPNALRITSFIYKPNHFDTLSGSKFWPGVHMTNFRLGFFKPPINIITLRPYGRWTWRSRREDPNLPSFEHTNSDHRKLLFMRSTVIPSKKTTFTFKEVQSTNNDGNSLRDEKGNLNSEKEKRGEGEHVPISWMNRDKDHRLKVRKKNSWKGRTEEGQSC